MATFSKIPLSGSTDGRGPSVATTTDEIWLYAVNYDSTDRKLTIEWGGATAGGDIIEYTVKAENGLYLIVPGLIIKGNATPLVVAAFAATTSAINIFGYVNRITA